MALSTSVFEMVHQVLGDAKTKLASSGKEKAASAQSSAKQNGGTKTASAAPKTGTDDAFLDKLASACDHLAANVHLVVDQRTPQEKIAEYAEINKALMKKAFEVGNNAPPEPTQSTGDGNKGSHQTAKAEGGSIPPTDPSLNSGAPNPGGPSSAMEAVPNTTSGEEAMQGGNSGEAEAGHRPPHSTEPGEKPTPTSAANAMETNHGMMMPSQPEGLLRQAGGDSKTAAARANRVLSKVSGQSEQDLTTLQEKAAAAKKTKVLMAKAAQAGIPAKLAASLVGSKFKVAEDALNPAQISGGSAPELQSEPGIPSPLSQGSEAGSNTPRGTAPTSGEGGGRDALSSNESAINAKKGQLKQQGKGALAELLTEPMQSAAHDKTLQMSLDNTSSAGVKISAARELLKKLAASSPEARKKVAALAKLALDPEMAGGKGTGEETLPEMDAGGQEGAPPVDPMAGEEPVAPGPSEAAIAAVQAGVTPDDLLAAHELLEGEPDDAMAAAMGQPTPVAPVAGAEDPEKVQNATMGYPGGSSPAPTPMMG